MGDVLTDDQQSLVANLCRLHIEDYEDGPQTGVAVDDRSIEQLRNVCEVCES